MPVVVVMLMTVVTLLGFDNAITKFALVPSKAVAFAIDIVGNIDISLSIIVHVAVAIVLAKFVEFIVALTIKVSVPSIKLSSIVGTLMATEVAFAGIVIIDGIVCTEKSVDPAVPAVTPKTILVCVLLGALSAITKTAVCPSTTVTLVIETNGNPPVFTIVQVPIDTGGEVLPLNGDAVNTKVSFGS